jgi:hypothetical protein
VDVYFIVPLSVFFLGLLQHIRNLQGGSLSVPELIAKTARTGGISVGTPSQSAPKISQLLIFFLG